MGAGISAQGLFLNGIALKRLSKNNLKNSLLIILRSRDTLLMGVSYKWVSSGKSQKLVYRWGVTYSWVLLINWGVYNHASITDDKPSRPAGIPAPGFLHCTAHTSGDQPSPSDLTPPPVPPFRHGNARTPVKGAGRGRALWRSGTLNGWERLGVTSLKNGAYLFYQRNYPFWGLYRGLSEFFSATSRAEVVIGFCI